VKFLRKFTLSGRAAGRLPISTLQASAVLRLIVLPSIRKHVIGQTGEQLKRSLHSSTPLPKDNLVPVSPDFQLFAVHSKSFG